ncbi:MAG TPA: Gfo/Idh/MocA family oxidoreductase [Nitrospirales bacterium]|jgi:predicted dehydrogenase|nr:Gfo/Idh/MocA family oxidoreductase [Nitrospirales bacterium]
MEPIRVGVIGVGSLGQHHARVYAELPGSRLVGVADVDKGRAESVAARHGCQAMTDYRKLIEEVDAVSVVAPTLLHHEIARTCLMAGLHVLVEKPLTATVEQARDLVTTASTRNVTLQVGHIERFNSAFRATQGAIKAPLLIECQRWAPFTFRGADVDVVLDLMIHDLDLVLGLIGVPVREVQADGLAMLSPTTDVAQARVVFQNGCVATFSANRVAESKIREVRVWEPEGFVMIDLAKQTAVVGRRTMGTSGSHEVLTEQVRGDGREPLKLELEAFLDSIRTGAAPLVSGQEGMAALELAYAIMNEIATHPYHHG